MSSVDSIAVAKGVGFSEEALREMSGAKGEPEWLLRRRLEAWQAYERMPAPSRKDEEWRRTDLSMLDLGKVAPLVGTAEDGFNAENAESAENQHESLRAPRWNRTSIADGDGPGGLAEELAAKGVILAHMDAAVREHPDLVRRYLLAQESPAGGKFGFLHAAFWSGGTFVHVPRDVEVGLPIDALAWAGGALTPTLSQGERGDEQVLSAVMPHTLVVVESGGSLVLVDEFGSAEGRGPAMANAATELVLGQRARLHYVSLQRWGGQVYNFSTQRASLGRDAQLTSLSVVLGGRMTKSWVEAALREPGAGVRMVGIMFGGDQQRFHHHTLQDHQAPNTTSDLLFKVALSGRARSEYSGLIRVHPGAHGTDAYQANRNLLLSPDARADSMPKLEIENNDVRCTHGATVGPIDEEQVFYLESRGLPRAAAERMIVEGFFEPLLDRIPVESVRDRVRLAVEAKMAGSRQQ